jgi:4'-phosphopantetheinyl transferase EntD
VGLALPDDGAREEDLAGLHADEAAHARGLSPFRRLTWVGGRLALRAALRDLETGGAAAPPGPILPTARGAPALGPGFVGSVSHKGTVAVALAARATSAGAGATLGVDVEIDRPPRADIARRVLTADERRRAEALDPDARARELLVFFSAKEAIYKALDPWVGRHVSFQEVAISRDAGGRLGAALSLARVEGPFAVEVHEEPVAGLILTAARVRPHAVP